VEIQDDLNWLAEELCAFLGFTKKIEMTVEAPIDFISFSQNEIDSFSPLALRFFKLFLKRNGNGFLPLSNRIFSRKFPSENSLHLLSMGMQAILSERKWLFESPREHFYPQIMVEALSYFGSKILSPFRVPSKNEEKASFKKGQEFTLPKKAQNLNHLFLIYREARKLGEVSGELLYMKFLQEEVPLETLQKIYQNPFNSSPEAKEILENLFS
jgi:hypothetical protein